MFWRKKQKEHTPNKGKQTLTKDERIKELLDNPIYRKVYLLTETLAGKKLFPDFFALVDLLEQQFKFVLENKAKPLETVSAIETLQYEPIQKAFFTSFLSDLLITYATKHSDDDARRISVLVLASAKRLGEQSLEEIEQEISQIKNKTLTTSRENKLLWKKIERYELLKIDLKIQNQAIKTENQVKEAEIQVKEADIQRLTAKKKYLEEKVKEAGLTLPDESQEKENPEKQTDLLELPQMSDISQKTEKTRSYPPHYLEQIIKTAARLYEKNDKVRAIDIYTEIGIEKNTYNSRIRHFGYDTVRILDEARARIRDRESSKK